MTNVADLLDRDGYLWREPLIEPIPAYPLCGCDFRAVAHDALDGTWDVQSVDEFGEFVACGAFSRELQPYEHQRLAFEQSVARRARCGRHYRHGLGKDGVLRTAGARRTGARIDELGSARSTFPAMGLVG